MNEIVHENDILNYLARQKKKFSSVVHGREETKV